MNDFNSKTCTFCTEPWTGLMLRWGGRVQPCCMNSTPVGDIYKDSIDDIWNSKTMQNIRQLMREGKYEEAGCHKDCNILHEIKKVKERNFISDEWENASLRNKELSKNLDRLKKDITNESNIATCTPVTYEIQTTEFCNMGCIMCHQEHHNPVTVSPEYIQKMFPNVKSLYRVRFQGGEVFIDKSFVSYLVSLKESLSNEQKIIVITNGALISAGDLDLLTEGDNPVNFIISMDSLNPDIYKKIRQSSSFEKVKNNIVHLSNIQKKKNNFEILTWNFVVMKSNFYSIKEAISFASEHNIKLSILQINGEYKDENIFAYPDLREKDYISYLNEAIKMTEELNANVSNLDKILSLLEHAK